MRIAGFEQDILLTFETDTEAMAVAHAIPDYFNAAQTPDVPTEVSLETGRLANGLNDQLDQLAIPASLIVHRSVAELLPVILTKYGTNTDRRIAQLEKGRLEISEPAINLCIELGFKALDMAAKLQDSSES